MTDTTDLKARMQLHADISPDATGESAELASEATAALIAKDRAIADLKAENAKLRKMVSYADHKPACRMRVAMRQACTCGFREARAALTKGADHE